MANSKISALPAASIPLAGTELVSVVQSGITEQVTVDNLTAGRAVNAASLSLTITPLSVSSGGTGTATAFTAGSVVFAGASGIYSQKNANLFWDNTNNRLGVGTTTPQAQFVTSNGGAYGIEIDVVNQFITSYNRITSAWTRVFYRASDYTFNLNGANDAFKIDSNANFIVNTAAKGINFTANTPLAGMTSRLLNWYEEGTWTPNQGAGLILVGVFSSTGRYTRIGRQVSISGTVTGTTSVAVTAAGVITSNLPFTVVTTGHGSATNISNNSFSIVICTSTNVTSAAAITATATITFSATYFV